MYSAAVVFATAPFLYIFVTSPGELMAVRFYHGFATAIFGTVASAAIVDNFPDLKAAKLSFYSSATIVGRSVAPFLGGAVIVLTNFNYRDVYWVVALAGVSAFLAIVSLYHYGADGGKKGPRGSPVRQQLRSIVTDRKVLVASSMEAAQYLAYGAFEVFSIDYALNQGLEPIWWALIGGAQLLMVIFTKPLIGKMSDLRGRDRFIIVGLVACAIAVLLFPLTSEPLVLVALSALFGLGFASVTSFMSDTEFQSGSKKKLFGWKIVLSINDENTELYL
jgi:MFS family permease